MTPAHGRDADNRADHTECTTEWITESTAENTGERRRGRGTGAGRRPGRDTGSGGQPNDTVRGAQRHNATHPPGRPGPRRTSRRPTDRGTDRRAGWAGHPGQTAPRADLTDSGGEGEPPGWSYHQTGSRRRQRVYRGEVIRAGGAAGQSLRRDLTDAVAALLSWAADLPAPPAEDPPADPAADPAGDAARRVGPLG